MEIALKNRTILQGDVLEKLREIPTGSIDCVISSPPYWGLRDYQAEGQWGLETDFKDYLEKMRVFMQDIKRVMKGTGTVWINLGDTYSGGIAHADWTGNTLHGELNSPKLEASAFKSDLVKNQIQAKSRFGIPERFYVNCIDDGWLARNHIPWIKVNSMPSSVKDRFTNKWESIFFFAKEQKYYFNLDAVREKPIGQTKPFNIRVRENITGYAQAKLGDLSWTASHEEMINYNKNGERKFMDPTNASRVAKFRDEARKHKADSHYGSLEERIQQGRIEGVDHEAGITHPNGKNPGDVFKINPRPFAEAHFATFPIDLPLKILKCACPENGFVLDPFFGAGTVGMAAEKLGLNWVGIELKQEYIEIARKRLEPYENQKII